MAKIEVRNFLKLKPAPNYVSEAVVDTPTQIVTRGRKTMEQNPIWLPCGVAGQKLTAVERNCSDSGTLKVLGSHEIADRVQRPHQSVCRSLNCIRRWLLKCIQTKLAQQEHPEETLMSDTANNVDRVSELVGAICDENASENVFAELDSMVLSDQASCRHYLNYCRLHVALRLELRAHRATQKLHEQIDIESVVPALSEFTLRMRDPRRPCPSLSSPPRFTARSGYLSSDWPVAYLAATVIFGIGLLIGSLVPVSQPAQIARQSVPLPLPSPLSPRWSAASPAWSIASVSRVQGSGFRVQDSPLPPGEGQGVRAAVTAFILHPSSFILHPPSLSVTGSPWHPA